MRRSIAAILVILLSLAAGVTIGWRVRGTARDRLAKETRLVTELDRIATHTTNLQLLCANRTETARRFSEDRLFEAIARAEEMVAGGFRFGDAPASPNLTESVLRAAWYAKANNAGRTTVDQAQRLYEWLRLQQIRPVT